MKMQIREKQNSKYKSKTLVLILLIEMTDILREYKLTFSL